MRLCGGLTIDQVMDRLWSRDEVVREATSNRLVKEAGGAQ